MYNFYVNHKNPIIALILAILLVVLPLLFNNLVLTLVGVQYTVPFYPFLILVIYFTGAVIKYLFDTIDELEATINEKNNY